MKQPYRATRLGLVCFISVLPLSACKVDATGSGNLLSIPPAGWTQVYVQNSTLDVFSTSFDTNPIPVGAMSHILGHPSNLPNTNNPNSFDISRESRPLARVSYRVLRWPTAPNWQSVIIIITEAPAGVFGAATPDSTSTWIQVLSVQHL